MTKLKSMNTDLATVLGIALPVLFSWPAHAVIIPGDPADGEINSFDNTVDTTEEEHLVGHQGTTNGTEQVSSIYLFELPDFSSSAEIYNAALFFTHNNNSGSFSTNPANADVWGLGYVPSTPISTTWHFSGDSDTRTGNDLGTGVGTNPVVKIVENILTPDSDDPGASPRRIAAPDSGLLDFLHLIYDQGASEGDFAVVRINIDQAVSISNRRFDIASADDPEIANRPELRINENTVLLFDPFDDGDRTNGTDPRDTDWFSVGNFNSFGVVPGFDGDGLFNVLTSSPARELGGFPEVLLEELGDFIRLSVDFQVTFGFGFKEEAFRMGLYHSKGTPVTSDTTSGSSGDPYEGNMIKMSLTGQFGSNDDAALWGDPPVSLLGGNPSAGSGGTFPFGQNIAGEDDWLTVVTGGVYNVSLIITKTSTTGTTLRAQLENLDPSAMEIAYLLGEDNVGITNNADGAAYVQFDAVVMGSNPGNEAADFIADNIRVETSVTRTVASAAAATDAIELVFSTQPGVRYGLEAATDLIAPDWTDQGVTVIGDGGSVRVYDPDPFDPDRAYRLTQKP
jgi:hypothetical protein